MDFWKFFTIGHRDHTFCNPFSGPGFDELIDLLALPDGARVLDIACGKAEFLVRTAQRWSCRGVGVDLSPAFAADARAKVTAANLESAVEIVEANGSDYDGAPGSFDAAFCLGASWIWGGHAGTLQALSEWVKPGGSILVGEPFWKREPTAEHLAAAGYTRDGFGTHRSNAQTGIDHGLVLLHAVVSSADDWDRYEGYQWLAVERYAQEEPDDPDVPELLSRVRTFRDHYLEWGRDEMGWGVYLFSKPLSGPVG